MVTNLPANAGDTGLVPGSGNKIPPAMGPLSPWDITTEPVLKGPPQ